MQVPCIQKLLKRKIRGKMKNFLKQVGKAVCYTSLFIGMQFLAFIIFGVIYVVQVFALLNAGFQISQEKIVEGINTYLLENTGWIAVLSGLLTLFFAWFVFAIRKKKFLKEANLVGFSGRMVLPIILLAVFSVLMIQCAFELLPIPEAWMLEYEESVVEIMGGSLISIILANVIMAPVVEEVIFRGLVLSRLRRAMPTVLAVFITSITFGLLHGQILWICYAACLGIMMGFIAINCKSTLASMLYHLIFNLLGSFHVFGLLLGESRELFVIMQVVSLVVVAAMIFWLVRLARKEAKPGTETKENAGND